MSSRYGKGDTVLSFEFHANVRHFVFFVLLDVARLQKKCNQIKLLKWIHFKPSLFQHVGTTSSLKGKVQKLKVLLVLLYDVETWISFSHSKLNFRIKISGNWRCSRRTKIHRPKWHRPSKRTSSLRSNELTEATLSFGAWCPKLAMTSSLNLVNPLSSMDTDCEAEITNTLLTCFTIHRLKYGRSIRNAWKDPWKSHPVNTLLASVRFTLYRMAFHFRSISIVIRGDKWKFFFVFLHCSGEFNDLGIAEGKIDPSQFGQIGAVRLVIKSASKNWVIISEVRKKANNLCLYLMELVID